MISVRNAYLHNLKNIDVDLPTGKLIAVSGVSGSGKSTLAFDILFEAGRRSYLQALGVLASLGDEHGFDEINGLMPTVAIKQGIVRRSNPRSVVGTKTRLLNYLAALYADQHNRSVALADAIMPSQFSFNSPMGMCLSCEGRGVRFELDLSVLVPTPDTTLMQVYENALAHTTYAKRVQRLHEKLGVDSTTPFLALPEAVQQLVFYGKSTAGIRLAPLYNFLQYKLTRGKPVNGAIKAGVCSDCDGYRIGDEARNILVNGKHIGQLGLLTISELYEHLTRTSKKFRVTRGKSAGNSGVERLLLDKALSITSQLIAVKLDYLTAYRPVPSLSGGEMQRLFLMGHLKADIAPLLYIFDEPTSGLHELEKAELIERLKSLSLAGNTVAVVEHDAQSLQACDYVVDIGPLAGRNGGEVMYQGSLAGLKRCKNSLTGQYLTGKVPHNVRSENRSVKTSSPRLVLQGVHTNNLKNVKVSIPLGVLVGVAGMSGSGKSSLIADTLVPAVSRLLTRDNAERSAEKGSAERGSVEKSGLTKSVATKSAATNNNRADGSSVEEGDQATEINFTQATPVYSSLTGIEYLDKCVEVSQAPIGRRSNSNVVSYLGVWDRIRNRFAKTTQAREAGFSAGHFSFNAAGACQQCHGNGQIQLWLGGSFVSYPCDECKGQRYLDDIVQVKYNDHSITDVLALSVAEASEVFSEDTPVTRMLDVVARTGMDYITLGQPTNTLSGGEAQRIKLAKELGRSRKNLHCLYILDEPTTGLSMYDTGKLMLLLQELVSLGNSVIVVEHDPMVLSQCDWLLELGPAGGDKGGRLVAAGPPHKIKQSKKSLIGAFLR